MYKRIIFTIISTATASAIIVLAGLLDPLSPTGVIHKRIAFPLIAGHTLIGLLVTSLILNWRKWQRRVTLAFAFLFVLLLILEIYLRFFHVAGSLPQYKIYRSKEFHHVHPKNETMIAKVPGTGEYAEMETDRLGLRKPNLEKEFNKYEKNIVILGDSFTFGLFIKREDTYAQVAEDFLRESLGTNDIAVLNAGVTSYSPLIEQIVADRYFEEWKPTLVILMLDPTDIGDDYFYSRRLRQEGHSITFEHTGLFSLLPEEPGIFNSSLVYQRAFFPIIMAKAFLTRPIYMATHGTGFTEKITINGVSKLRNRFFIYRHPLKYTEGFFRSTLGYILNVRRMASDVGARFLLVVSPRFHHWNPAECPKNWEASEYKLDEPYQFEYFRFFDNVEKEVDFPIFDLLPYFQATEEFPLVFESDPHWNARGHRLVGMWLAQYIMAEGLLTTETERPAGSLGQSGSDHLPDPHQPM